MQLTQAPPRSADVYVSDFAGHTLRVGGGDGIFLDVLWLSKCLSPILSHKLKNQPFDDRWLWMRDDLAGDGILRRQFAFISGAKASVK